ncbi:MAG: DUF2288 family protein [Leptolyngbyaceae cyanobacterium RU_5_1]|nr:DUF2288 family protein [Leptolyngbyaceae cyanobacterium RU_5_1]
MQHLRTELAQSLDEAEWNWLSPHARRNSLIVVAAELDLLDVGVAIASDDISHIKHWIDEALIQKPSQTQLSAWNQTQTKRFKTLIVQPYVLVQEVF